MWLIFGLLTVAISTKAQECTVDPNLIAEIKSYKPVVDQIISAVINGPRSGILYNDLADYVDTFGPRLSGTENLERAIDDVIEREQKANLTTSTHSVMVTHWERGDESAEVITPRRQKLTIIGLGSSANTSEEGITAEVIVIKSFDDLQARKNEIPGKIVLYNVPYTTYGETGRYRNDGPNQASKVGAVAALVRSITPFSIDSPHTGDTDFDSDELRIPAAAITLEDAEFINRLSARGLNVTVNLKLSNILYPKSQSRNVIGDIVGATKPNEYVVISGHIDSWDVGQGALDDAGGAFLAWHSLALINALGLPRPARTIRSILWTAEEPGLEGVAAYRKEREDEARNWTIAFESDEGVFKARGIEFAGTAEAACILREITALFVDANGTEVNIASTAGSDIGDFQDLGIPLGAPFSADNNYFWFHHSKGDWVTVLKSEDLDQNLAIFASATYILANLSVSLPKAPEVSTNQSPPSMHLPHSTSSGHFAPLVNVATLLPALLLCQRWL